MSQIFRKYVLRPFHDNQMQDKDYLITIEKNEWETITAERLKELIYEEAVAVYEKREQEFTPELMRRAEYEYMLHAIDSKWEDHIDNIDQMRQSIGLQSYAQRDPLVEYQIVSYDMFEEMIAQVQANTIRALFDKKLDKALEKRLQRINKEQDLYTNMGEGKTAKPVKVEKRPGVNDKCPCGSGLKYKRCCKDK
jgi:preprotein translocase subunit SecA